MKIQKIIIAVIIVIISTSSYIFAESDNSHENKVVEPIPIIAPIGTTECIPTLMCDSKGNCKWIQVCK